MKKTQTTRKQRNQIPDDDGEIVPGADMDGDLAAEMDDILPPDGEIQVMIMEIVQPGNAREVIGQFSRQQIGDDLASFIGNSWGGGVYYWKLKDGRGKWLDLKSTGGRRVSGTLRISERSHPRRSTTPAGGVAPGDAGAALLTPAALMAMMMERETRAHDLFLKAAELRATPAPAPAGMGIGDLLQAFKMFKDLMPASPTNSIKDTIEMMTLMREAFPSGGDEDGGGLGQLTQIVQGIFAAQPGAAVAALPAPASAVGGAPAPQQPGRGKMLEMKIGQAVRALPSMAAKNLSAAEAVDQVLYTWTPQQIDELEAVIDQLTVEKVKEYLPEFAKYEAWYVEFFKVLHAEIKGDKPEHA